MKVKKGWIVLGAAFAVWAVVMGPGNSEPAMAAPSSPSSSLGAVLFLGSQLEFSRELFLNEDIIEEELGDFRSSNGAEGRNCSASGDTAQCSVTGDSKTPCSATGADAACSARGGGKDMYYCSSDNGPAERKCSVVGGSDSYCSAYGTPDADKNRCSAKNGTAHCSVFGPAGKTPSGCSALPLPGEKGTAKCTAFSKDAVCSVSADAGKKSGCTSIPDGAGPRCSAQDAEGKGKCSVIKSGGDVVPPEELKNCYGTALEEEEGPTWDLLFQFVPE